MTIVPQFTNSEIQRDWGPIVDEIIKSSGVKLKLKFYPSIPDFEQGFLKGELDFAYMNPYHVVMANTAQKYQPFIRDKKSLVGILVVSKDSKISSVKDLNNKEICFPSPNAFAASLWIRALLTEEETISFSPKYVKTHSNVFRDVVLGRSVAGGAVNKTLKQEPANIQESIKILYQTKPVPSHPFVAHPRVPQNVVQKIQTAFLTIKNRNQQLLSNVEFGDPIVTKYDEYKFLKKLNIEKYVVLKDN